MKPVDPVLLWLQTILFGVLVYWGAVLYISLFQGHLTPAALSEALAMCGGILMGSSFALSGLGYFFDLFDTKVKYRKMLGICGYLAALAYAITLVLRFPDRYISGFFTHITEPDVILGLAAMSILTFMACISWQFAVKRLGKYWRPALRLGYIAYLLLILRAIYVEGDEWKVWSQLHLILPPARLSLTIFASLVILLRIILEIALRTKKKTPVVASPSL